MGVARLLGLRSKLRCSFCGQPDLGFPRSGISRVRKSAIADVAYADQVGRLVAGPSVYICDQCIETCVAVLQEHGGFPPSPNQTRPAGV